MKDKEKKERQYEVGYAKPPKRELRGFADDGVERVWPVLRRAIDPALDRLA